MIADGGAGLNIKGSRYELWCATRELGLRCATVCIQALSSSSFTSHVLLPYATHGIPDEGSEASHLTLTYGTSTLLTHQS